VLQSYRKAFESNQSGIETSSTSKYMRAAVTFESNQSGIETGLELAVNEKKFPV